MQRFWPVFIGPAGVHAPMGYRLIRVVCFVCVAGVAGCALLEPESIRVLTPAERQKLYDIKAWALDGRVAVHAEGDAWHAGFSWEHDDTEDVLRIAGPLGQGAVDIVFRGQWIRVTRSDGTSEVSDQPDELLRAWLGVAVPLSALRYWVLGVPEPGYEHVPRYDVMGQLRALRQQGWNVIYERYTAEDEWVLPKKILITNAEMRLKIIVDQWTTGHHGKRR